jgi:predicted  nucleic acid-binding Zn ribbon protein
MNPIHYSDDAFRQTQEGQEMKEINHPATGEKLNDSSVRKTKKEMIRQIPMPWRKKEHTFDPVFFKCDNKKIVKYESKDLKIWRVKKTLDSFCVF